MFLVPVFVVEIYYFFLKFFLLIYCGFLLSGCLGDDGKLCGMIVMV